MPLGAAAWMPCSGVTVPLEFTPALPPPTVIGLVEASAPMTAIDLSDVVSGRTLPEFFSSTVPSSASCVASAWSVELVATADGDPLGALSNRPKANIWVKISDTAALIIDWLTWPEVTALCSAAP